MRKPLNKPCKHPLCPDAGPCKKAKPPAPRKPIQRKNRTPLKRKKRINPTSAKQKQRLCTYSTLRKQFLKEGDLCELRTPVCTSIATCIHHVRGRVIHLLNTDTWLQSCIPCNGWVESNHKKAEAMKLKMSKFKDGQ